ncbi:hypothetical protein KIH74_00410 [Kineosporia sp. J2-2]|uniref:Putative Flp pilus-assembly TadG-like N-terminal domain-containing protein n=1 Tax=Kineosporia corallincola TaxID=2835133 RepID=A0ABS5T8H6_9ACTN|nr:Rv3654c family TadE-like protein [Kineosporia corallincola]MBT0767361.1 hypothetical protein [Kineosporia corallincola]
MNRDRGSGTVLMIGLVGVAAVLMAALLGLGGAVVARHRAGAAADLAALAAVDSGEGCAAAGRVAAANGARLAECDPAADGSVRVTVTVEAPGLHRTASASARAAPGPARTPTGREPPGTG